MGFLARVICWTSALIYITTENSLVAEKLAELFDDLETANSWFSRRTRLRTSLIGNPLFLVQRPSRVAPLLEVFPVTYCASFYSQGKAQLREEGNTAGKTKRRLAASFSAALIILRAWPMAAD